jgi:hypothetical protein
MNYLIAYEKKGYLPENPNEGGPAGRPHYLSVAVIAGITLSCFFTLTSPPSVIYGFIRRMKKMVYPFIIRIDKNTGCGQ